MSMKTDELITVLSQNDPDTGNPPALGLIMPVMTIIFLAISVLLIGARPDIGSLPIDFYYKSFLLLTLLVASVFYARQSLKTVGHHGGHVPFYIIAMPFALWLGFEWVSHDLAYFQDLIFAERAVQCILTTLAYALVGLGFLTLYAKKFAPNNIAKASHTTGLVAGMAGALGYSIHCAVDSPTYLLLVYGLPVVIVWGLARILLPKALNW